MKKIKKYIFLALVGLLTSCGEYKGNIISIN